MRKNTLLKNTLYVFQTIKMACPGRIFLDFLATAISSGIYLYLDVIFLGYILKMCEESRDFTEVLVFIAISMLLIFFGKCLLSWFDNRYIVAAEQETRSKLNYQVFKKAVNMDVACYEDTEFFDQYSKTLADYYNVNIEVYSMVKSILINILGNIAVAALAVSIDPLVLVFCFIPFFAVAIFGKRVGNRKLALRDENIKYERKAAYSERTIYLKEYAKEMRLFRIYEPLKRNFNEAIDQISHNILQYGKKIAFLEFLSKILFDNIMYFGLLIYLIWKVAYVKDISLSDWLILLNSVTTLAYGIQSIADDFLNCRIRLKYVNEFKEYFEYKPKIPEDYLGKSISNVDHVVRFENVSFTYKGKKEPTLKNISMEIGPKEKIAIVGCNGAGKSTLIKLLLRLYDPDQGKIFCDGTDIKEYTLREYRELFGTVLQDSKIFSLSIAENVLIKPYKEKDKLIVENALEKSTFKEKADSLEKGIKSILTKEFEEDGVVLSGGEAQKIIISRVFANKNNIVVLDEPSSALDPIAEKMMFHTMFGACKDKSMVFISHRLANVVSADRIYVMDNGMIVEEGSHTELLRKNGLYADMFHMQARNYLLGKEVYNG